MQPSENKNWLNKFIDNNSWSLIILVGSLIVFYTTIDIKVKAAEDRLNALENLVSRVIVLEEQNKHEEQVLTFISSAYQSKEYET